MKHTVHDEGLYKDGALLRKGTGDPVRRLMLIEELLRQPHESQAQVTNGPGRNWLTRALDALFASARRYAFPIYWTGVVLSAALFFLYARLVAFTMRPVTCGERQWPDVPAPCVLALWHGEAPSLLTTLAARRPQSPVAIMVARDPRGDCLALLCQMLGLRVARGESGDGGWRALAELAREIERGSSAIVTADGGGPARVAKVGAVALASASGVPLLAIGADCRPALAERHKWDRARNPLPFGRVSVALGEACRLPALTDLEAIERARRWLQRALEEAAATSERALE